MLFLYHRCKGPHPGPPSHPRAPTPLSLHLVERRVPDGNTVDLGQDISGPCLAQALSLSCSAIGKALEPRHTTPHSSSVRLPDRLCHIYQASERRQLRCVGFRVLSGRPGRGASILGAVRGASSVLSCPARLANIIRMRCCSLRMPVHNISELLLRNDAGAAAVLGDG